MPTDYDILIAGGGMVGASLAAALLPTGLRMAVLEAHPFGAPQQPSYDDRSIALAYGSRRILEGMGLWEGLAPDATPIKSIHVSERGRFGATRLHHHEEGVPALGYVVENRVVGRVLMDFLQAQPNIHFITPAKVLEVRADARAVHVRVEGQAFASVSARLLVAADGSRSAVRQLLGVPMDENDYGQSALIANVTPQRLHGFVAYERFTDTGPLALLPLSTGQEGEGRCSLVWTHRRDEVDATLGLSDAEFLGRLEARFGHRLGRFLKVGQRASYPLALMRARELTRPRVALIGNAAHTVHPVAGQGFNLGLRDVAVLADVLAESVRGGRDPGEQALLETYAARRKPDLDRVLNATDGLARLFTQPWPPLAHARGAGLVALDLVGPLRHRLARQSMGLTGTQPRLARGLPLLED